MTRSVLFHFFFQQLKKYDEKKTKNKKAGAPNHILTHGMPSPPPDYLGPTKPVDMAEVEWGEKGKHT